MPGQDWEREIIVAVRRSDAVLVCLTRNSINKRGFVQREIRYALDAADNQPEGSIFLIPVKLEECEVPDRLQHLHWVNLFENRGYEKLLASLQAKGGKPAAEEQANEVPVQATGESHRPQRQILGDLIKGLLLIAFFLTIKIAMERTTLGQQLSSKSYDYLHLPLSTERMPVTILDISDLVPESFTVDGHTGMATSRDRLKAMIEAIAAHEPKAIGVAIDFSPDESGFIHPNDPQFFQFCLDIRQKGVPVFLGINRTVTGPAPTWLGSEQYRDLAANLYIPIDSSRMIEEVIVDRPQKGANPSRSLSAVLADSYSTESDDSTASSIRESIINIFHSFGFIEKISEKHLGSGLTVKDFPVDFSQIDSIDSIRTINPIVLADQSQRKLFYGKVVLIGDMDLTRFSVPGRSQSYAGISLQASAAYTLIRASRFDVTRKGRLGFNVLFWLATLTSIILVRLYYKNRYPAGVASQRSLKFFSLFTIIAATIVGVMFVRVTRIIWDDFLLAPTLLLIFHPQFEHSLQIFWNRTKKIGSTLFSRIFKESRKLSS